MTEEDRYRLLVEAVSDYAIFMLDPSGIVTSWNLGAQRIKGYAREEIVGRHFARFYTEDERESGVPETALETATREGRFEREGRRVRKDGSVFWGHIVIDAIRDDSGELIGFAKITRDISERREAQETLERTREALFQAQKMEAIGQLTGGIAHDFNNLLMAVLSSLELMSKRLPNDPRLHALLENAVEGAHRGTALTNRLLAFARRQELKLETVDIGELVRGMTELLQRVLGPGFRIATRFPLSAMPVRADSNQLEMAVLNLVVNARDAMSSGGEIIIAGRKESVLAPHGNGLKPGHYIALAIADSGEGMDEATLKRATEPFFTTKGVGKGTGLGLSMVHGFAEQSGGAFNLRSKKGEGTTAEIWLPMSEDALQRAGDEGGEGAAARGDRGSLAVLAVDDDRLVLINTVAMIEDLGHEAFSASSGTQALEILRREAGVDVVVTDQAMPHMTGVQLAEAIAGRWPDLPVILTTGYAEVPQGSAAGLRKLSKPFSQNQLAAELASIARKRGAAAKLPAGN